MRNENDYPVFRSTAASSVVEATKSRLSLLGLGGGGGGLGSFGNSNSAGPSGVGPITVNAGSGSNTVTYVILGVVAFIALLFIVRK